MQGRKKLTELKAMHIQHFYNELFKNGRIDGKGGLSAKFIKNIHVALHSALEQAVNNDLIVKNPLNGVTLPKQIHKPIEILTQEEQK
jgi:site-specific recombinase XerD